MLQVSPHRNVIARSVATKQSILEVLRMDCFASLAMTDASFRVAR